QGTETPRKRGSRRGSRGGQGRKNGAQLVIPPANDETVAAEPTAVQPPVSEPDPAEVTPAPTPLAPLALQTTEQSSPETSAAPLAAVHSAAGVVPVTTDETAQEAVPEAASDAILAEPPAVPTPAPSVRRYRFERRTAAAEQPAAVRPERRSSPAATVAATQLEEAEPREEGWLAEVAEVAPETVARSAADARTSTAAATPDAANGEQVLGGAVDDLIAALGLRETASAQGDGAAGAIAATEDEPAAETAEDVGALEAESSGTSRRRRRRRRGGSHAGGGEEAEEEH